MYYLVILFISWKGHIYYWCTVRWRICIKLLILKWDYWWKIFFFFKAFNFHALLFSSPHPCLFSILNDFSMRFFESLSISSLSQYIYLSPVLSVFSSLFSPLSSPLSLSSSLSLLHLIHIDLKPSLSFSPFLSWSFSPLSVSYFHRSQTIYIFLPLSVSSPSLSLPISSSYS